MNGVVDDTYAQTVAVLPAYARGIADRLAALWAPPGAVLLSSQCSLWTASGSCFA